MVNRTPIPCDKGRIYRTFSIGYGDKLNNEQVTNLVDWAFYVEKMSDQGALDFYSQNKDITPDSDEFQVAMLELEEYKLRAFHPVLKTVEDKAKDTRSFQEGLSRVMDVIITPEELSKVKDLTKN